MHLQSRAITAVRGAAWEAYLSCDYLLRHILAERERYSQIETSAEFAGLDEEASQFTADESRKHIKTCIESCWGKLDDYYKILDTLPAYMTAIVLHPGQKIAYIEAK